MAVSRFATDDLIKMVMKEKACSYEEAVQFLLDYTQGKK